MKNIELIAAMNRQGVTSRQLAHMSKLAEGSISRLVTNRSSQLPETAAAIAKALGVKASSAFPIIVKAGRQRMVVVNNSSEVRHDA